MTEEKNGRAEDTRCAHSSGTESGCDFSEESRSSEASESLEAGTEPLNEPPFEVLVEDTSIFNLFRLLKPSRVLVADKSGAYGMSYPSVEALERSPYVHGFKAHRISSTKYKNVVFEACPLVFPVDMQSALSARAFEDETEFLTISNLYFLITRSEEAESKASEASNQVEMTSDKNDRILEVLKFPKSLTELIESPLLSNQEKNRIYTAILKGEPEMLEDSLFEQKLKELDSKEFSSVFSSFGRGFGVYPLHGLSEIVEGFAMINAQKGCAYLIDRSVTVSVRNENGECKASGGDSCSVTLKEENAEEGKRPKDKVNSCLTENSSFIEINSRYGCLLALHRLNNPFEGVIRSATAETTRIRLVLTSLTQPTESSVSGRMELPFLAFDKAVRILALDSSAKVCPANTSLIYFIARERIPDELVGGVLKNIGVCAVLVDVEFVVGVDLRKISGFGAWQETCVGEVPVNVLKWEM